MKVLQVIMVLLEYYPFPRVIDLLNILIFHVFLNIKTSPSI